MCGFVGSVGRVNDEPVLGVDVLEDIRLPNVTVVDWLPIMHFLNETSKVIHNTRKSSTVRAIRTQTTALCASRPSFRHWVSSIGTVVMCAFPDSWRVDVRHTLLTRETIDSR